MPTAEERRELTIRAAWLYHERGYNQHAVAQQLGVSRSTVSRLLTSAEQQGIVRVVLTEPLPRSAALAERLIARYGLRKATVEVTLADDPPREAAARAMARRLEQLVLPGSVTIATGWGRTLGSAAQQLRSFKTHGVTIVDAFGHTTTDTIANAVEVSNTVAHKIGARVVHVPSPGFAPTAEVAASFYDSEPIAQTLERARTADAVIVAIGVVGVESLLVDAGYLGEEKMVELIAKGAVGEVFGMYFDSAGQPVMPGVIHPISLTLDELRSGMRVIAAVGGANKVAAIRGAIAAGIVNELATDDSLAEALLADD